MEIYTDGACRGNPGPGGWGLVAIHGKIKFYLFGSKSQTTNNEMELQAFYEALKFSPKHLETKIISDSKYVVDGFNKYLSNWSKNQWKDVSGNTIKNVELWKMIYLISRSFKAELTVEWIKGHSENKYNDIADRLANRGVDCIARRLTKN